MADHDLNLSGMWKGIFHYPYRFPPNQFDAELRDFEGHLSGETIETDNVGRSKGQRLVALIEGSRDGNDISFTKQYDDLNRMPSPVHYHGKLSQDGTEISGMWSVAGSWSGSFLMIRSASQRAQQRRMVAETVR